METQHDATPLKKRKKPKPAWTKAFLTAFRVNGNVTEACKLAGKDRTTVWRLRQSNPEFAREYQEAKNEATDRMEEECDRRAVVGLVKKKFTKSGEPIIDPDTRQPYYEREYSDTLLMFRLKALRPDLYRERASVEHSGPKGGEIPIKGEHEHHHHFDPRNFAAAFQGFADSILGEGLATVREDGTVQPVATGPGEGETPRE